MTTPEKEGALLFFGKGRCVQCHSVSGQSNEMFSDFQMHVIGVPQIAPFFGWGRAMSFSTDQATMRISGWSKALAIPEPIQFRTSPLRNAALQPAFFHNGAFRRLEDAIRHHLDVFSSARNYDPMSAGVDKDLTYRLGPIEPVLQRVDPLRAQPSRSPQMSSNIWWLSSATASSTNVPTSRTSARLFLMLCRVGFQWLDFKDVPSEVTLLLKSKRRHPREP